MKSEDNRFGRLRRMRLRLSLVHRFAVAATFVIGCGMIGLGIWVSDKIEEGVIQNVGAGTALYTDSLVGPVVQSLATDGDLSVEAKRALNDIMMSESFQQRVVSFKLWNTNGLILYSSVPSAIGQHFDISDWLPEVLEGRVMIEFDALDEDESVFERSLGVPLLEFYSPIREIGSDRIIAVAEYYENATDLKAEIGRVRLQTWLVVGGLTLLMTLLLFRIVRGGGRTIERQRHSLEARVCELQQLLERIRDLKASVERARRTTIENNDLFMRRLGAELHDGPGQFLALAQMNVADLGDAIREANGDRREELLRRMESLLGDAISEIRNISVGLSAPELDDIDLTETLTLSARNHSWRTGAPVDCRFERLDVDASKELKLCAYRLVQEGLANGYLHAGGVGQAIEAGIRNGELVIEVVDEGPGLAEKSESVDSRAGSKRPALGIIGMRERVESLGGKFFITSNAGSSARVSASFDLQQLRFGADGD